MREARNINKLQVVELIRKIIYQKLLILKTKKFSYVFCVYLFPKSSKRTEKTFSIVSSNSANLNQTEKQSTTQEVFTKMIFRKDMRAG